MRVALALAPLITTALCSTEYYPLTKSKKIPGNLVPYRKGELIPIECIDRHIDNGEHKFDPQSGEIIYVPFPSCRETGVPLALEYGVDSQVTCTLELEDTLFHLFQLYVHQDAPFSCRIPVARNSDAYVPLTFNLRGHVPSSHLDVDASVNVVLHEGMDSGTVVSGVGYSSGTNLTRVVIGDALPLKMQVTWFEGSVAAGSSKMTSSEFLRDGWYVVPRSLRGWSLFLHFATYGIVLWGIAYCVCYVYLSKRLRKQSSMVRDEEDRRESKRE